MQTPTRPTPRTPIAALTFTAAAVLWLALLSAVAAQEVPLKIDGGNVKVVQVDRVITIKEDRTLVTSLPFAVQAVPGAGLYFWSYPAGVTANDLGDRLEVTAAPEGELTVTVKLVSPKLDKDGRFLGFDTRLGRTTFYVGKVSPGPTPPDPKPPDPPVPPTPSGDLRVLMIKDAARPLSAGHTNVWNSTALKALLDAKCVKGSDGRPEWRKWAKDQVLTKETPTLTKLWADTRPALVDSKLPSLLIVRGEAGKIYPLPETEQGVIDLLRKEGVQ